MWYFLVFFHVFCDLKLKIHTLNVGTLFVLLPGGLHIGCNVFVTHCGVWFKAKRGGKSLGMSAWSRFLMDTLRLLYF